MFEPPDLRHVELPIVARGASFVVVDKPAGLLAVPGRGEAGRDCVTARVARGFALIGSPLIVHRLDMDTSGLMIVGLTPDAQRHLCRQFAARTVEKSYTALLAGRLSESSGTIRLPFRLDVDNRPRQIYDPKQGKMGETHWRLIAINHQTSRVHFLPRTGRTHQLRVHAAHRLGLGRPILGDRLYGDADSAPRLMLHADHLGFVDPDSGAAVTCVSSAPF